MPEELAADWQLKVEAENETIDVVLEKYGYDVAAIMEEGTPEEQATFDAPPDAAAAQDRILAYESEVCGTGFPAAADVSYEGEEPGSYCELVAAQDEQAAEALASGDPAASRRSSPIQAESGAAIVDAAPDGHQGRRHGGGRMGHRPAAEVARSPRLRRRGRHARGHRRRTGSTSTSPTRTSASSSPGCWPTKSRSAVR